jgi:hypothetical protein
MIYENVSIDTAFTLVREGAWTHREFREWLMQREDQSYHQGMAAQLDMTNFYEEKYS